MVAIIILNWNGWEDTIACLDSLLKIKYNEFFVFVGDNGSTNESKEKISSFCKYNEKKYKWIAFSEEYSYTIQNRQIYLWDLQKNHGFAKGNNILIREASKSNPDYYLLLNNDTEVEPDFLSKLVQYQKNNSELKVLTPLIHYYDDKSYIWNAGGNLFWGIRKYHYGDASRIKVTEKDFISCTFITGCALFCVPDVLMDDKKLFTEAFFHGEEDFDFGLRMKKQGIKMGCVIQSVIYHKVGRTSGHVGTKIGLAYCHYLNRFINLRHHLNTVSFYSFVFVYSIYVIYILLSKGFTLRDSIRFYWKVLCESLKLDGVSNAIFMKYIVEKEIKDILIKS